MLILLMFSAIITKSQSLDTTIAHITFLRDITSYTVDFIGGIRDSITPDNPKNYDWMKNKTLTNKFLYDNNHNLTKIYRLINFTINYQHDLMGILALPDTLKLDTITNYSDFASFRKSFHNTEAIVVLAYLTYAQSVLVDNETKLLDEIVKKVGLEPNTSSHEDTTTQASASVIEEGYYNQSIEKIVSTSNPDTLDINYLIFLLSKSK
jgi:hypothetical protein